MIIIHIEFLKHHNSSSAISWILLVRNGNYLPGNSFRISYTFEVPAKEEIPSAEFPLASVFFLMETCLEFWTT